MAADSTTAAVMGDIFVILVGEMNGLIDGEEIRSVAGTDICDVRLRGEWYRLHIQRIDTPITIEEYEA